MAARPAWDRASADALADYVVKGPVGSDRPQYRPYTTEHAPSARSPSDAFGRSFSAAAVQADEHVGKVGKIGITRLTGAWIFHGRGLERPMTGDVAAALAEMVAGRLARTGAGFFDMSLGHYKPGLVFLHANIVAMVGGLPLHVRQRRTADDRPTMSPACGGQKHEPNEREKQNSQQRRNRIGPEAHSHKKMASVPIIVNLVEAYPGMV